MQLTGLSEYHSKAWRLAALALLSAISVNAQPRNIDTTKSTMTVRVYKAGVLSAFGHDHEISAPIASGSVDMEKRSVELQVKAATLRVVDAKVSEKDRAEVQANMVGPDVLDTATHTEISFHSTAAESAGTGTWKVSGELSLHGQSRPVSMEVHEKEGHFTGSCRFKITDFGIKPVKAAGGTIRVKDEVQIEFDIQLTR